MGFIADNFGTYADYLDWNDGYGTRQYIVKLINNDLSTSTILKSNPDGILNGGIQLERSKDYHCVAETISYQFMFEVNSGNGGGDFLIAAYENKGVLANVYANFYKHNPDTDDFDILYEYKADFNKDSYDDHFVKGMRVVSINFVQQGLWQKFTARDELELDVRSNDSVDGGTISSVTELKTTFPEIDIYYQAESDDGDIAYDGILATDTYYAYFNSGNSVSNSTDGRVDFESPTSGKVYNNDSGETRYISLTFQSDVTLASETNTGSSIYVYIEYITYNASDVVISTTTLSTLSNVGEGVKNETKTINKTSDSSHTIPDGGYVVLRASIVAVNAGTCTIDDLNLTGTDKYFKISERSDGISSTTTKTYRATDLFKKLLRKITGIDDCYSSTFLASGNPYKIVLYNGYMLRGFSAGKAFNVKFLDAFKSVSYAIGLMLDYDTTTGKIIIEEIENAYQDELGIDFGTVANFRKVPSSDYMTELLTGCQSTGEYDDNSGVNEFNVQVTASTVFEVSDSVDMRIPAYTDTIANETIRRLQYTTDSTEDTDRDSSLFMSYGGSSISTGDAEGFDGADQYYNTYFVWRENIWRNRGILSGLFWKDTSQLFNFSSSKKDIEVTYYSIDRDEFYSTKDDIDSAYYSPFFYGEDFEFDAFISDSLLNDLVENKHKYHKCTDEDGNEYYLYIMSVTANDDEKKLTIKGKHARINRT